MTPSHFQDQQISFKALLVLPLNLVMLAKVEFIVREIFLGVYWTMAA